MSEKSIVLCMGTRPEIIKMAPVWHALRDCGASMQLLHTGQHLEMAEPMYRFFGLAPDHDRPLTRASDRLAHLSALILDKIGEVFDRIAPRAVLVHGDTTSALMATLAAFYQKIPVGHVEAGLRSHDSYDPFPEEKNREIIGRLARWHFAPTPRARHNLLAEGVADANIEVVGNSIVDAVALAQRRLSRDATLAEELQPGSCLAGLPRALAGAPRLIVVTAHRRENWGAPMASIAGAVRSVLQDNPDVTVVWPVHLNPKVDATVRDVFRDIADADARRLFLVPPVSYPSMLWILERAWLALTDSGGIQEEAACLNVPILVMRETTERPELIDTGGGALVGTGRDSILSAVRKLRENTGAYDAMRTAVNPFGDGRTSQRIVRALLNPSTQTTEKQ